MAEFTFNCPSCNLDLSVDDSISGQEVECPGCNEVLTVPTAEQAAEEASGVLSEALANAEILKPKNRPLDIAAKASMSLKIKTFRHHEYEADGQDTFDEEVSKFIGGMLEDDVVSIRPIHYSHIEGEILVTQYGIVVVYKST